MAEWWDDYAEGDEQDAELSRRLGGVEGMAQAMAQEMPPLTEVNVDTLRAPEPAYQPENYGAREDGFYPSGYNKPPQEIGPVDSGFTPDAPPAAVADALDKRDWLDRGINSFFGGIGDRVGGYLDKKFGTNQEWADAQNDIQRRLAAGDRTGIYAPMDRSKGGFGVGDAAALAYGVPPLNFIAGLPRRAFDAMGLEVQDMTPYGFALMDQNEAAAQATSGLPEPFDAPSSDDYTPLGGTPPAVPIRPQSGYAPGGVGGAAKSVKFRGYPDFTKANPYG